MKREQYLIVRLDHVVVPTSLAYVGHGDTPYDLNLRWTPFSSSATIYSAKRDAIREAKRLARIYVNYQIKVVTAHAPFGPRSRQTVYNSKPSITA